MPRRKFARRPTALATAADARRVIPTIVASPYGHASTGQAG